MSNFTKALHRVILYAHTYVLCPYVEIGVLSTCVPRRRLHKCMLDDRKDEKPCRCHQLTLTHFINVKNYVSGNNLVCKPMLYLLWSCLGLQGVIIIFFTLCHMEKCVDYCIYLDSILISCQLIYIKPKIFNATYNWHLRVIQRSRFVVHFFHGKFRGHPSLPKKHVGEDKNFPRKKFRKIVFRGKSCGIWFSADKIRTKNRP
jgi:hypothetical protein